MSLINKLNIFSEIDQQFVNNIKLFYLNKHHLLFVSFDDNVHQYNTSDKQLKNFEKFVENQCIIKCICSNDSLNDTHFMTLTDDGCVYSWGHNSCGQLGNITNTTSCPKPQLINSLSEEFIIDISCGGNYSLVLSQSGYVYAFGDNSNGQCGCGRTHNQLTPIKLNIAKVIAMSCGTSHSIALTASGEVFGWGYNRMRQLGIDGIFKQRLPIQLSVPSMKQVMCGPCYTLMLSTDGDLYFCGQIKTQKSNQISYPIPTKLNSPTKFIRISATNYSDLSVALSSDNLCFIFGKYNDEYPREVIVKDLLVTNFVSIGQTFAFFEQITYKCVETPENGRKTTIFENSFKELNLIKSGGFSSVFKCEHRLTMKLYAIKKISFEPENEEKVLKELKILSELESNFIVKYNHSWIENNYYLESNSSSDNNIKDLNQLFYSPLRTKLLHIQMELCPLILRDAINITRECLTTATNNELSLTGYYISSELLHEILECVQYLHQQNPAIIHRDLKPENILLSNFTANNNNNNNRFVKITDFGLSTTHSFTDESHTKYRGTKGYKAPELDFTTHYTTKVDIYSLGIIAMELFGINNIGSYENDDNLLPFTRIKTLALSALNATPERRPDCNRFLSQHSEWRLTNQQLMANEEFSEIIGRRHPKANSIDKNFIEYFVQNKFESSNNNTMITIDNKGRSKTTATKRRSHNF